MIMMIVLYFISAANCDRKNPENYKIGLENSWIFFQKSGNPGHVLEISANFFPLDYLTVYCQHCARDCC